MTERADAGDTMPDIALETPDGGTLRPSDFRGRKLALFFYPKDDTPGCTVENKDFSELLPEFEKAGTAVLGVSKDPRRSTPGSPPSTASPLRWRPMPTAGFRTRSASGAKRSSTAACSWACTARPIWSMPKGGSRASGAR